MFTSVILLLVTLKLYKKIENANIMVKTGIAVGGEYSEK